MNRFRSKLISNSIRTFFYSQTQNFIRKPLKPLINDVKKLPLLQNSEYIKENLSKLTQNPSDFNKIFADFLKETASFKSRPSPQQFEALYFRNLVKLVSSFIQFHKTRLSEMDLSLLIDIFLGYANIYQRFGSCLKSSKTILFTNKLWKALYERKNEISYKQALNILEIMSFLGYTNQNFIEIILIIIRKNVKFFEINDCLKVLKELSLLRRKNEEIIEVLLDRIYPRMKEMRSKDLGLLALNLSKMHYKVNKHFLLELMTQFSNGFLAQKLEPRLFLVSFGALCELETLIGHKFFYLDELDEFFQGFLGKIEGYIEGFDLYELGILANGLQKIGLFDEKILGLILKKTEQFFAKNPLKNNDKSIFIKQKEDLLRGIEKLEKDSVEYKAKLIEYKRLQTDEINKKKSLITKRVSFENYVRIIHCFSVFYYKKSTNFLQNFLENLQDLVQSSQNISEFIDFRLISRFLYSLAILLTPKEIASISNELLKLLAQGFNETLNYPFDYSDISSLKLLYLYLKQANLTENFPSDLLKLLNEGNFPDKNLSKTSYLSLEVSKTLKNLEIPHRLEPYVEGDTLTADLVVEKENQMIFIDVHGFQHYFRNEEKLKGGSLLKIRLFNGFGTQFRYVIVPIFEWQLIGNEKEKEDYLMKILNY